MIGHDGSWQGFQTSYLRFEGGGPSIVVLTNSAAAEPQIIGKGIAALIDPALVPEYPCKSDTAAPAPSPGCAF